MKLNPIYFSFLVSLSISFFFLLATFFIFDTSNQASFQSALSTTGSYFGAVATLGAAVIAAHLFNDWREEKNYDLEQSYLSNIISNLKPLHFELLKIRSDAYNLKKIDEILILKTEYISRQNLDLFEAILKCYPDVKIYSELKNDHILRNLYKDLEHHCFCLSGFYNELFQIRYGEYYNKVIQDNINNGYSPPSSYNIFRSYGSISRKKSLKIQIYNIKCFFQENHCYTKFEECIQTTTFEFWLNETIDLHEEMIEHCIKNLKP